MDLSPHSRCSENWDIVEPDKRKWHRLSPVSPVSSDFEGLSSLASGLSPEGRLGGQSGWQLILK